MQFGKAVAWIGVTSILFAVIGAFVGFLLGRWMSGYYRSVFDSSSNPEFDPVAVGLGQGLTQGMVLGAAIGLVLILSYWWKEAKLASLAVQAREGEFRKDLQRPHIASEPTEELRIRK